MGGPIETRKTYRAVLSEPKLVVLHGDVATHATQGVTEEETPQLFLPTASTSMLRFETCRYFSFSLLTIILNR